MFKVKIGRLFILFMLVFSAGFSLTASDIFVSLDKNVGDLTGGYAEFTIKNPTISNLVVTSNINSFFYAVRFNNTPTLTQKLYIWKNISHNIPSYTNITFVNNSQNYSRLEYNGTTTNWFFDWSPFNSETFLAGQTYKIKVSATWEIPKKVNGVYRVSRDWFPFINISNVLYNETDWAWWNASYGDVNNSIAVFPLNESSYGDGINSVVGSVIGNAIQNGSVGVQTGHILGARGVFNSSNYLEATTVGFPNGSDNFTISVWIKPIVDTPTANQQFVHIQGGGGTLLLTFRYNNNGLEFYVGTSGGSSACNFLLAPVTFKANNWYLATASYDHTNNVCYIYENNTELLSSGVGSRQTGTPVGNLFEIGNNQGIYENAEQFYLEQVSVWNRTADQNFIDWLYNNGNGQNTTPPSPPPSPTSFNVSLIYPEDALTNTTNNIYFGYIPLSNGSGAITSCSLYINGTLGKTNSTAIVNNSLNVLYTDFANPGTYAWSIGCSNTSNMTFTANRTLTLTDYSSQGAVSVFELTRTPLNVTLTFSNYTYSNVGLVYNNTYYPTSSLGGGVYNVSLLVPIVQANNSALPYYWNYTRTNSSISEVKSTSSATQNVYFSYFPSGSDASSYNVIEGSTITVYMFLTNLTAIGSETVVIDTDGSNHTTTYLGENNSLLNYSYTFNVGTITPSSLSKNWTWYSKISYLGLSRNVTLTTVNVTIYKVTVTDCSSGLPSFVYKTFDEENGTYLNDSNYNLRVETRSGNITTTYSSAIVGQTNITVCLYPTWANATADLSLIYSGQDNSTYSQRTYYNFGVILTNVTQIQNVYLLNSSNSYLVNINTRDQYGSIAPNVLVYFERFNYTSNSFFNVTNVYTTEGGTGLTYLIRYDVPYKIILRDTGGNLLSQYDNYFISSSPITLRTVSAVVDVYQRFLDVSHSCAYNSVTKVLTCSYNDPNSILTRVEFIVKEVFNYATTVVCAENKTTFTGEFTCDLSATDNVSKGYYYEMSAYDPPATIEYFYVLEKGNINRSNVSVFGANGVVFALFFFITMFFIGIWKPVVAVMLGIASIFLSYLIGWLNFGTAPEFIIGTVITIGLFVIWKLKER